MLKYIRVLLALVPAGAPAAAQAAPDSVTVRVAVTRQGAPLPGAVVRWSSLGSLASASGAVTSGASGRVALRLAIPGEYRIAVTAIGYAATGTTLRLSGDGRDTLVAIPMPREAEELEELVVSSTRTNRRIEEQPLRVEVLAREEIEEKLLMTPGDISMMLNETGGLRVQTTSPSLGGANVRVQGLRGRYTLILADGLPLYGGQAGGLGLLQIPPMDLGQVEIIKGASSALYGSSALGGVINLLSRQPPAEGESGAREALVNATSLGGTDAILWATGRLSSRLGYTLLGGGHRQGRRDRDGDGWTDVPGYRRVVARPRLFWEGRPGQSLFLTGGVTREHGDGGTFEGRLAPDGAPFVESLATERYDAGAVARLIVASGLPLTLRASAMTQGHRHRFGETRETDRHGTWFLEGSLSREVGRAIVVAGAALQGERYRHRQLDQFDYDVTVPGVFLHGELPAGTWLVAALSARLDRHSRYGSQFNPRLSLLVPFREGWSVRASAGTGYFAPTPFTEETEVTGLSRLAPLSGLRAEQARNASLDLQGLIGPLELSATLFGSSVEHPVQLAERAGGAELVSAEAPTRTWGVDLVWRYRRDPLSLTASYTYTRATELPPDAPVRSEVPLTPRHAAGLVAVYERHGRTRIGAELYYTGRQLLDDQTWRATSRPYLIVGALAEQRIGPARLFLNLENLGGVRQTRFVPLVRRERASDGRWTTDAWAPLEGRVLNGGVRLRFGGN